MPVGFQGFDHLGNNDVRILRIGFEIGNYRDFHAWELDDIKLLRLLGEIVANALTRQSAAGALQRAKDTAESANRAKSDFLASMATFGSQLFAR